MHKSYPKHTTINDLVKACPGCGGTVAFPFTQDPFRELGRKPALYQVSAVEKAIGANMLGIDIAYSVGAQIPTFVTKTGKLWHEPCYALAYVRQWQIQMQQLTDMIQRRIDNEVSRSGAPVSQDS